MVNGRLPGRPGRSPGRAPGRHGMREIRAVIDALSGVYLEFKANPIRSNFLKYCR
jgi:hypothetical protein